MAVLDFRRLTTSTEMMAVEDLQRIVRPGTETDLIPVHFLMALAQNGGLVIGAFDGQALAGFLIGYLGAEQEDLTRPAMSRLKNATHMLGIHPEYKELDVEIELRRFQRVDAIENGVPLVTWIYDPLQSEEADLSIRRLGAVCNHYLKNYYGNVGDEEGEGFPSDRFQVDWFVSSRRVESRVEEIRGSLDFAQFLAGGARKAYETYLDPEKILRPHEDELEISGAVSLVEIPFDIDSIKAKFPQVALSWRKFTRGVFESAFAAGYIVTDFVRLEGERIPRSYYVLSHGEGTLG
jgi:predicted GNAT superfamily acetyltransferase